MMTEAELVDHILKRQTEGIEIKYIKKEALESGFVASEFERAMDAAQIKKQQTADSDIWSRITLGPTLIIIGCIAFYTDYAGRSFSIATFIGLVCVIPGIRMIISLIKQWSGKKIS